MSSESKQGLFFPLVDIIDKLSQLGLGEKLNVPRIVVGGNQSAGKSSVLEAISEVSLPRNAGTCTRCPIEIQLRPGKIWQCLVKLRFEDGKGQDIEFGKPITDKSEVGERVSRAQRAVLNPHKDHLSFLNSDAGNDEHEFTRDMVVLNISGPKLPTLTLVDLPGLIQFSGKDQQKNWEQEIHDLLVKFATPANTIIVCVITAKEDVESQGVLKIAQNVDPEGKRTLGVLTKPDTIEEGTHQRWAEQVVTGSKGALKLGYYMVKNPSQQQLDEGMHHHQARC